MEVLRTPDERFAGLPGYDFDPNYVEIPSGEDDGSSLRVHYVDEGPTASTETVLLLHGEPSWSFLYRRMIPILASAGFRVIAPDLIGFGRSDKPASRTDYTYARHVQWLRDALLRELDLSGITLFGQDWGGLLGLRLVAEHSDRFRRVVAGNTGLPTGDDPITEAFLSWQRFSQEVPEMPIGRIVSGGTLNGLAPEVIAAYDAPFPDERFKEGARQFPALVPTAPDDPASEDNRRAWEALRNFTRPFLCAFSDSDPITKGSDKKFLREVPGTNGQPHSTIHGAAHFLQEDQGEELAKVIAAFIGSTRA